MSFRVLSMCPRCSDSPGFHKYTTRLWTTWNCSRTNSASDPLMHCQATGVSSGWRDWLVAPMQHHFSQTVKKEGISNWPKSTGDWFNVPVVLNKELSEPDPSSEAGPHSPAPEWDMRGCREPPINPQRHVVNCPSDTGPQKQLQKPKNPPVALQPCVWILPVRLTGGEGAELCLQTEEL